MNNMSKTDWTLTGVIINTLQKAKIIILLKPQTFIQEFKDSSGALFSLTLQLTWVTKTEFLPTMVIQYQADKWWE